MMLHILFLVYFISSIGVIAQAGLSTPNDIISTLTVDIPSTLSFSAWTAASPLQSRRDHDYSDEVDGDDDANREVNNNDDDDDNDANDDNNDSDDKEEYDDGKWHNDNSQDNNDDDDDDDDEDTTKSNSHYTKTSKSSQTDSSTSTVTLNKWSSTGTPPVLTAWSASTPSTATAKLSAPTMTPTAQALMSAEKMSLIISQANRAKQRAMAASQGESSVVWLSPMPGDAFAAGSQIVLQWNNQMAASSHFQLRLCILRSTADLGQAQSGSIPASSCGAAVDADSTPGPVSASSQVSFGAPNVMAVDSFFVVISPSNLESSSFPTGESANFQRKRDLTPIVSPAFVLAPNGVDLSGLNSLSTTSYPSASPTKQSQQVLQTESTSTKRPISWSWIVGPIIGVLCILVICALVYSHRNGRRSARKTALQEARQGEERWREETRKEVDDLAESTMKHAARWSYTCPPSSLWYSPSSSIRQSSNLKVTNPSKIDEDPYTYLPSNLGEVPRRLERNSTNYSSSTDATSRSSRRGRRSGRVSIDDYDPYANLPSSLGEVAMQSKRTSTIISSPASVWSSPSLCAQSIRRIDPYKDQAYCESWTSILDIERDYPDHVDAWDQSSVVAPPIPAALLPCNDSKLTMSKPHEVNRRPVSLPTAANMVARPPSLQPRSRILSFGAAEASSTTGKRGTAYDFIGQHSMQRADHVNDLYSQLKQALQQPSYSNSIIP